MDVGEILVIKDGGCTMKTCLICTDELHPQPHVLKVKAHAMEPIITHAKV